MTQRNLVISVLQKMAPMGGARPQCLLVERGPLNTSTTGLSGIIILFTLVAFDQHLRNFLLFLKSFFDL